MHPRSASPRGHPHPHAAIVDADDGHPQDDATAMCLDWHGTSHSGRDAATGADLTDASARSRTAAPHRRLRTVRDGTHHSTYGAVHD
ncbi:hypothetical protein [Streptomyces europaeiscabiei]|uniref:Uncharacterized protein n=1 Tax=Streptomyces europaeiscabiei TaxID=146819 RepID=A0ABU4NYA3_9ACTN|nr:hypothetical protein [Streptomyces europaeiscabiei]MDX2524526.1 hypothetical protein [Streptomyces europaeiscabiei]MDX2769308.1 hypothetical protein [Streptomyces europaeiscabiei]MDX3549710.1 hypothetical protein [Streptomyces europaeiscabiei]MDX3558997.1 hypothetical protein [Streptomyces europaeiscabiei]MDX3706963.1 hypothetical protein [Streptomyces europaeiscabiei]